MSFDLGTALQLAGDIAGDAKSPSQVVYDALTLYKTFRAVPATGSLGAKLVALDRAGLLDSAVNALADLAPVLQALIKDPKQKAQLLAVAASL